MTIEMTTTGYKGLQTARLRGANIDRIDSRTKRAVWGTWTPEAIEDDNAPEYALAATEGEDLLDLVPAETKPYVRMATPGQQKYMASLAQERGVDLDVTTVEFNDVDAMLTKLKNTPRPAAGKVTGPVEIADGIYLLDGEIYKVQHAVHGSGNQYAKRLIAPEAKGERAGWEYAPGLVRKLTPAHKMTLAQAEEFGALYGVCVRCGKVLTDETSISAAMGPVCRGKF